MLILNLPSHAKSPTTIGLGCNTVAYYPTLHTILSVVKQVHLSHTKLECVKLKQFAQNQIKDTNLIYKAIVSFPEVER